MNSAQFSFSGSGCVADEMESGKTRLLDPAQPDTPKLLFDFQDFHVNNISHLQNYTAWDLRAMEQSLLLDADVDECPKVHDVAHRPFELHAGHEVFRFEQVGAEDRQGGIRAWVPARAHQLIKWTF